MGLSLLLVELVVLYAPTVVFLWERWTLSVWHNAHGALVPPIVAFLIYQELKRFRGQPAARGSAWGFVLLLPALLLHAVDAGMHTQLLAAVSIVIALPGLSLLLIGSDRTRAILFPLVFLLAALPIPLGMTEQIHLQLRLIATAAAAWIVPALGIPVFVEGTTLHLATGPLRDLRRLQRLLDTLRCRRRSLAHGILDPRMEAKGVGAPGCRSLGHCGKHPPCRVTDGACHLGGPLGASTASSTRCQGCSRSLWRSRSSFGSVAIRRRDGPIREAV